MNTIGSDTLFCELELEHAFMNLNINFSMNCPSYKGANIVVLCSLSSTWWLCPSSPSSHCDCHNKVLVYLQSLKVVVKPLIAIYKISVCFQHLKVIEKILIN